MFTSGRGGGGIKMKRNTRLVDNDSDNEIWQYGSAIQLKHSKLRRPGKNRTKIISGGDKPALSSVKGGSMSSKKGSGYLAGYRLNCGVGENQGPLLECIGRYTATSSRPHSHLCFNTETFENFICINVILLR